MKYNKTKKALEMSAVIIAIVACAIDLILEIIDIVSIIPYFAYISVGYIIGLFIGIGLIITIFAIAIKLLTNISIPVSKKT